MWSVSPTRCAGPGPGGAEGESPGDPLGGEPALAVSTCAAPPLGRPAHFFDISFEQCRHYPALWEARGREGRPGSDLLGPEGSRGEDGRQAAPRAGRSPGAQKHRGNNSSGNPPEGTGLFLGRNPSARTSCLTPGLHARGLPPVREQGRHGRVACHQLHMEAARR